MGNACHIMRCDGRETTANTASERAVGLGVKGDDERGHDIRNTKDFLRCENLRLVGIGELALAEPKQNAGRMPKPALLSVTYPGVAS